MPEIREMAQEAAPDDGELQEELLAEGYLLLVTAVRDVSLKAGPAGGEEIEDLLTRVREGMLGALRARDDAALIDRHLVGQVEQLSAAIDALTEELGTRPNIDEIANKMGISQERVLSILKLTGEDREDRSYFPGNGEDA